MKILIVSGFLGAGKTTFIKTMAEKTGRRFVIVENEFGGKGVDGALLRENGKAEAGQEGKAAAEDEMKVWELTEGCICCSLNLDFAQSVLTIANSLDPDYLIVEPSGVALPGRILEQLHKISYDRIGLLAPVTIVDALHYRESRAEFGDYFSNQLYTAGTVVLSKSESMTKKEWKQTREELKLEASTGFPEEHYSRWSADQWMSLLHRDLIIKERRGDGRPLVEFRQGEVPGDQYLENLTIEKIHIPNADCLMYALELLARGALGRVVRGKGFFSAGEYGLRFDLVEGDYAITGYEEAEEPRVVIIGQNLQKKEIQYLFREAFRSRMRYGRRA